MIKFANTQLQHIFIFQQLSQLFLSQDTSLIYDREEQLDVDYSKLPTELKVSYMFIMLVRVDYQY